MQFKTVQIEITEQILASLIEGGLIHAADFRCLDFASKKAVWKLFLTAMNANIYQKPVLKENHYAG